MSFLAQYELLELVSGGAVTTFKARERSSGREVMVHRVSGNDAVQKQVLALPLEKRAQILGQGEDEGESYVVTAAKLPGGVNFEAWLRGPTGTGRGQWESPVAQNTPSREEPGEFTKMFQTPPADAPTEPMPVPKRSEERRVGKECRSRWSG